MVDTSASTPGNAPSRGQGHEEGHGVRYERDDVPAGPVYAFVGVLGVGILLTFAGLWGMFVFFNRLESDRKHSEWPLAKAERERDESRQRQPMPLGPNEPRDRFRVNPANEPARGRSYLERTPRLEGLDLDNPEDPDHLPEHTVGRNLPSTAAEQAARENHYLDSFGPMPKRPGRVHVPIELAMRDVVRLTPARPGSVLPEWLEAPGRSSSGRVSRTGYDAGNGHVPTAEVKP